jgi:hypothetical protein
MAFSVTALTTYIEEQKQAILTSILFQDKTASLISAGGTVMSGVKSTEKLTIMDTDAIFQTGGTCGFNSSGATTFTQREMVVGKIKVHESLCPKTLETKWLQKKLANGSQYDSFAFASDYTGKKAARIAAQLETAIWQGDTSSVDVNLNKFDGIEKLVGAATGVVNANAAAYYGTPLTGGQTASTIITAVNAMYKAFPTELLNRTDNVVFIGWDDFRKYGVALTEGKYFINWSDALASGEIMIPNTNIKLIAVNGLNGTNAMYGTFLENLYLGVDMLNEEERLELFFAKEADEIRFMAEWKYGVQFAFPTHIVKFIAD